jgi:hypothetical protein
MIVFTEKLIKEETLTPAAKLFYLWLQTKGEDVLCKGNAYFAIEFDVTTMTINNWLFSLEDAGYIKISYYKRKRTISCIY